MIIISQYSNPNRQLYYLGARVLEFLPANHTVHFFEIYESLKTQKDMSNISLLLFSLTLDWLFIIGAIEPANEGYIHVLKGTSY
jgi:hypothetical protein